MVLYSTPCCSFLKVLISLFEIQFLILISNAAPTYLYHFCPNTTTYVQNSTFQANLGRLLSDLSSNSSTDSLFYNATAGSNAPDIAYGLFLCRGDVTLDVCSECVKTATTEIVQRCPKQKQVITWYDECLLRYDNVSFFSISATSPAVYLMNTNNVTDPNSLDQVLGDVMDRIANSQSIGPLKGFATGESNFTSLQKVYSLVQCTPDLSSSDCNRCLRTVIGQLPGGRQGARVLAPSCNVRYETYPFYNGFTPPLSNITLTNNCNNTVWPGIISDGISQITTTGFVLQKGESKSFTGTNFSIGGLWGRTNCVSSGDIVACENSVDMYSEVFTKACPAVSSNPYNDAPRTSTCTAETIYVITFCPSRTDSSASGPAPPIPPAPGSPPPGNSGLPPGAIVGVVLITFAIVCLTISFCFLRRKAKKKHDLIMDVTGDGNENEISEGESLKYELSYIKIATNNFSADNKIGEGGFGEVFKGTLSNGQQVAVKRLSKGSGQGEQEFKNEVQVVARLQHRNLVRLLGYCLEKEEKILIYEYVPNESLDFVLFDEKKQQLLDWSRRYKIIGGVARGILYLHEDSRLRIIHRDIKASNVLLDKDMNAKISDFGLARIVGLDESEGSTNRVVGTFGYMSPEYIMHGQFSVKSDVFSFGVLVLEIISGKKNKNLYQSKNSERLLSHAWRLWKDGKPLDLVDPSLGDSFNKIEVIRCIHMGLLCVQEDLDDRPTMALVVLMLNSNSMTLPIPRQPAFFLHGEMTNVSNQSYPEIWSANGVSISEIGPR